MKTRWAGWVLLGLWLGGTVCEARDLPGDPNPPVLQQGVVPGQPPGLRYSGYSAYADNLQVEWHRTSGGTTGLFASSWYPENYQTLWLSPTTEVAYLKSPTGSGGAARVSGGDLPGALSRLQFVRVRELGDLAPGAGGDAGGVAHPDHVGSAAGGDACGFGVYLVQ